MAKWKRETRSQKREITFIFLIAFSAAGMALHNYVELPDMSPLNPQYLLPIAIYMTLTIGWLRQQNRRLWTWLIFLWGAVHLVVGAFLSVMPLSFWPFDPEQTARHYLAHAAYGTAQIPLLWRSGLLLLRSQRFGPGEPKRNRTG